MSTSFSAIVAGCTGSIGRDTTRLLVANTNCDKVIGFSRREIPMSDWSTVFPEIDMEQAKDKLIIQKVDYDALKESDFESIKDTPVRVFSCLGTTRKGEK